MHMFRSGVYAVTCLGLLLATTGCAGASDESAEAGTENSPADTRQQRHLNLLEVDIHEDHTVYDGPKIKTPAVDACPYTEEVDAAEWGEKFQRALDLGCEHDVHGEITFTEPIQGYNGEILGLISSEHALTVEEMYDAGYISDSEFQEHLEHVEQLTDQ